MPKAVAAQVEEGKPGIRVVARPSHDIEEARVAFQHRRLEADLVLSELAGFGQAHHREQHAWFVRACDTAGPIHVELRERLQIFGKGLGRRRRARFGHGSLVIALQRNNVAHAAARVGGIALVARDHVDVGVPDGLAGGFAAVGADVEAVRAEARFEDRAQVAGEGEAVGVLVRVEVPDGHDVAARQDEGVAGGDGEGIEDCDRAGILREDLALRLTEDAALQTCSWVPLLPPV